MSKVRVAAFSISLDGFGAGPRQDLNNPLGIRGPEIFSWFFQTEVFKKMYGQEGGSHGVDNGMARKSFENVGAWILGRNMFGPVRGPWPDDSWKGWWGEEPPYHMPVFVLTHYARSPLAMKGGTTFYFAADGIESALQQAKAAAGDQDVRIGGGVATIRQYLWLGPSMRCIWLYLRFCWGRARICSWELICIGWGFGLSGKSRGKTLPI